MRSTFALLPTLIIAGMTGVSPGPVLAARHHNVAAAPRQEQPKPNDLVLKAEVLLDRAGFSPGEIDARDGDNFANALHAFQQVNGLPFRQLDEQTIGRLAQVSDAPIIAHYTIQPDDVAGPFVPQIPQDFTKMAELPKLAYHSPRQALAEKFHMSEALLATLNPNVDFAQAGAVIAAANVPPMPTDPKQVARGESAGSSTQRANGASRILVDKLHHAVLVFGDNNRLLAFYPASIGSQEKPAPSGHFVVGSVSYDPTYTYDPAYAFQGQRAERKVTIKPGPNNPVGAVWIGLSAKGYGIHGTPDPQNVGKTQSHGCVRLTNWDALSLAGFVKKGTPVEFVG